MIAPRHHILLVRISKRSTVRLVQRSTEMADRLDQKLSLSVALVVHISAGKADTRMGRRMVVPSNQMCVEVVAPGRESDALQVGTG
jgi:hypothetical protein